MQASRLPDGADVVSDLAIDITLPGRARLDLTYAHPLDPPLLTGTTAKVPKDRFLISLTAQLLPWGRS